MLARRRMSIKKMAVLGGVLAVVWGTIGVVVYRSFFAKPAPPPDVVLPMSPSGLSGSIIPEPPVSTGSLNNSVLQDSRLIQLKVFGEVPLEVHTRGKQNPFEPYQP